MAKVHVVPALDHKDETATAGQATVEQTIRDCVEHATHLLPVQGPIEVFVHHNTLHAFEELPFHKAVTAAWTRFQAEPYLSEQEYRRLRLSGRIQDKDLEAAIKDILRERASDVINGLGTRAEIRFAMLRHPLYIGPDAELRWVVAETDALDRFRDETTQVNRTRIVTAARRWLESYSKQAFEDVELRGLLVKFGRNPSKWRDAAWDSFSLHLTWRICLNGVCATEPSAQTDFVRPRDLLCRAIGEDVDSLVQDVLIKFCAAYVDQGFSDWLLPNREQGFLESFVSLYSTKVFSGDRWLRDLSGDLHKLKTAKISAESSIENSLNELEVPSHLREEFITQSLLALGGWAGMIWQLESGVDWVVHSIPQGSLVGMLATQLILEKHAIRYLGEHAFGESKSIAPILTTARERLGQSQPLNRERRAFLLFQVAQMLGWTPLELLQLTSQQWEELSEEVESFTGIERRRVFHEAYERQYRHAAFDAFLSHTRRRSLPHNQHLTCTDGEKSRDSAKSPTEQPDVPGGERQSQTEHRSSFQILTCIDDREESFRRHLEEICPSCETFGAAGFFAVAMYYRGAADGFYKPLCPGVIVPDHYVQEDVGYTFEGLHQSRAQLRRRIGLASRAFQTRSRSFLGGVFAGIVGSLATIPLVARVLFPRVTARIRNRFGAFLQPPPITNLQLERYEPAPGPADGHIGYTTEEMSGVVVRLLQDIGLTETKHFSKLFIVCGHGSSSLNNPHESAYCCGACAGKRGGPNARAFAQMANDWRVRAKVAQLGIEIPDDTVFVGAYHNTCDDSVVFYDLDRLPSSHRQAFESAHEAIEEARARNAQERCRRFVSAPLRISPTDALRHVEARAQDISQARPEYNHATNALCIVGRREWSRGLFLDRRAFLTSYDPDQDDEESSVLFRILSAAIPVCAGINLEYYFSCVDFVRYGSGSKLPHNIVSLLGVMEGTSSDLRTGLYQQMVEIHEPVRLTFLIESTPKAMLAVMDRNEAIARLVRGGWVHLAVINPETSEIQYFEDGDFCSYQPSETDLPEVSSSVDCYQGSREHLPFFSIRETEVTS